MSNEDGDKSPRTTKDGAGDIGPTSTDYSHYDCSDADWDGYLTRGWKNVLWNNPDFEAWEAQLRQAGFGRKAAISDPEGGDLTNEIHPVFARQQWVQDIPDDLWEILSPVLRLASKMLLSKTALSFFRRVLYGTECRGGARTYLHYEAPVDVEDQEHEVRRCLRLLAQKLRFPETEPQTHAVHCVSHHHFGKEYFIRDGLDKLPEDNGQSHFLLINQAYAELFTLYARRRRDSESIAPSDLLRATFSLATSLVHETGHAFYARDRIDGDESYAEPFFDLQQHDENVELGSALEFQMFDVLVSTVVHPRQGVQLEWQPVVKQLVGEYVEVLRGSKNHLTLPMDPTWMHSLTTQAFWDELETKPTTEQLKGLYVPTEVDFGATFDFKAKIWKWKQSAGALTRYGRTLNERALAKKVRSRKQREKRKKAQQPTLRVTAGRYGLRSKTGRIDSLLSIAAGPIAL
jgi:Tfp pilus assembly protein PilV